MQYNKILDWVKSENIRGYELETDRCIADVIENFLNENKEAINYSRCCKQLKDKEENNIEIKTLGDLKRAYPEGKLHTVNGYGKIINYSVDGEIVYTRHL